MFGNHGLCGLLEEGAHEKSPKCLGGNLGDFGEFCKGLSMFRGKYWEDAWAELKLLVWLGISIGVGALVYHNFG